MKVLKFVIFGVVSVLLISCGAHKKVSQAPKQSVKLSENSYPDTPSEENSEATEEHVARETFVSKIPNHALEFLGTRYKYGGTTSEGMDCSGLIYTAFLKEDISLPRTSRDISLQGKRLNLDEVVKGDLLFFETNKKRKVINHIGLVVEVGSQEIFFIHSTTSRGVIISSLDENYWQEHFVMARRIQ